MVTRATNTAATGMWAQERKTDIIAHNLANLNTNAYKARQAAFADLIYQEENRLGASAGGDNIIPTGVQIGLGVKLSSVYTLNKQGEPQITENDLDLAINGKGYFRVELPNGNIAFTRDGSFTINAEGNLTTKEGYIVQPGINIPNNAKTIKISNTGVISIELPGAPVETAEIAQLELAMFNNEKGLKALGENLFVETVASGAPIIGAPREENFGSIEQGMLELSNVKPINEITSLIAAQRGYELCSKVIQASDDMLQTANGSKR